MARDRYQLIDSGHFQKLEQVGPYRFVRPAAQAVWHPRLGPADWDKVDAIYTRFSGGDGKWTVKNKRLPRSWSIIQAGIRLQIQLTDFGHLGIFPEQQDNWQVLSDLIRSRAVHDSTYRVLNLFAYTGGSTLAAAQAGASVTHVDASKTSVAWARTNAKASALEDRPIRWLVDDVQKFVAREVRRGSKYQGLILDPPSFGRGAKGEVWKIEEHLEPLLDDLKALMSDDFHFILLSAHSPGFTPLALQNVLSDMLNAKSGSFQSWEMVVREEKAHRPLPSGACCWFIGE